MSNYRDYETIELEISDKIGRITLNRPDALNAITKGLIDDLSHAFGEMEFDEDVRAVVITGKGRGFCAGADLAQGFPSPDHLSIGEKTAYSLHTAYNPLVQKIHNFRKPIISAVNGVAAGGGVGLALSADIVIAAKSAYFVQVFGPQLGLVPDVGCTYFVPRLVGLARAKGLALLGDRLPADKAADWGLIWECVEDDQLIETANAIAERLANGPTNAFGKIKKILDISEDNSLNDQLSLERDYQRELGDHPNFVEGVTAFLQKRKPEFK